MRSFQSIKVSYKELISQVATGQPHFKLIANLSVYTPDLELHWNSLLSDLCKDWPAFCNRLVGRCKPALCSVSYDRNSIFIILTFSAFLVDYVTVTGHRGTHQDTIFQPQKPADTVRSAQSALLARQYRRTLQVCQC